MATKDIDVNALSSEIDGSSNHTALGLAARNGQTEIIRLLLGLGANVQAVSRVDGWDWTALCFASMNGHVEAVRELLNPLRLENQPTLADNTTALYWASRYGHAEVIPVLVDKGADIKLSFKIGKVQKMPLLHTAANNGHDTVVELLIDQYRTDVNCLDSKGRTALHLAAKQGHLSTVSVLTQRNATVNILSARRRTALHSATQRGHADVVEALIACSENINPNAADAKRNTLLHLVAKQKYVRRYAEAGIQGRVAPRTIEQIKEGYKKITERLLQLPNVDLDILGDPDPRFFDLLYRTPLYRALESDNVDMVRAIVLSGQVYDFSMPGTLPQVSGTIESEVRPVFQCGLLYSDSQWADWIWDRREHQGIGDMIDPLFNAGQISQSLRDQLRGLIPSTQLFTRKVDIW